MKKLLLLLFIGSLSFSSFSQTYGNEWINYSQQYFSFKIWQDGVYRIYYDELQYGGMPLESIPVNRFQIFGKEKEIPIYVHDNNGNGVLNPGEYIEFYGERNTGWLDSTLYLNPEASSNPGYSLYNDTLRYFISWSTTNLGLRFVNETDVNYTNWPARNFVIATSEFTPNGTYLEGRIESAASSSFFVDGEGWGNASTNFGSQSHTFNTTGFYSGSDAPPAKIHAKVTSNSNSGSSTSNNHHLRILFTGNQILDSIYSGYKQIRVTQDVPASWITSVSSQLNMNIINDIGAITDHQALTYGKLEFPRNLAINSSIGRFRVTNGAAAKSHLQFTGVTGTNRVAYVWGGGVSRRLPVVGTNPCYVVVPNAANGQQEFVIVNEAVIGTVTDIQPVNETGFFTNFSAQNLEGAVLMVYHNHLKSSTQSYRDYRQSAAGGGHNVVLADIEELYWQFGGGVNKHINGIRRFAHLVYNSTTTKPKALFLIGKGVREANENIGGAEPGTRKNGNSFRMNLVPSFGYPSSDVGITARLEGTNWEPLIPTGRIAASSNQEVILYLNKVKEQVLEQSPTSVYNSDFKDWQKHVLHFGGGSSPSQINTIRHYLASMGTKLFTNDFGGYVHTYIKEGSDPFNPTMLNEVSNRIKEGVSIMTFFAHAGPDGFEINIDDPRNWNNKGRYPLVIGNACHTGDMFKPLKTSAAERFVIEEDMGAIAFLATVKWGFASHLYNYSNELYRQIALESYGQTVSEQVKAAIQVANTSFNNYLMETTCLQMTLHGDPLIRVNSHQLPEIEITEQSVFFSPSELDLSVEEFDLNLVVKNLGRSIVDSVQIEVIRKFPGQNADSVYRKVISRLDYIDTLVFRMPLQPNVSLGINQFEILVDIPSYIPEQFDEYNNNRIVKTLLIDVDGILPVRPYDFAVVPRDSVVLKASTVNPFADFNTYRFEIDTTDLFNSPQHRFALVSGLGGVKHVNPSEWRSSSTGNFSPLICQDSVVYFWRVAIDEPAPDWREKSFQYIENKEGWGQDHFYQFKKNTFSFVSYNRPTRSRNFEPFEGVVTCNVWDNANSFTTWTETNWYINSTLIDYNLCQTTPSIHVGVINPSTLEAWFTRGLNSSGQEVNSQNNFGNINDLSNSPPCRTRPDGYFIFRQNSTQQLQAFANMVLNEIPDSAYVLIYTPVQARYDLWDTYYPQMYNVFQALGSDSIYPGKSNRAFIFFGKKGTFNFNKEAVAQTPGEFLVLEAPIYGMDNYGIEQSTTVGPAARWETIYWKQDPQEATVGDTTILRMTALDIFGNEQLVIDTLFTRNDSIVNLHNLFDATQYPYLKLRATYKDGETFTPAQIDRWHVLYDQLPEAALDGENGYYWSASSDTIQEGQDIAVAVDIRNIGERHMDSLLVHYWIQSQNQVKTYIPYPRQDSLRIGELLRDTIHFNTTGLSGLNSLWIEVNPYITGSNYIQDQPEQFHFNNIAQIPFYVLRDNINPVLDVTFDGVHILNGDIVSPKSEIVITLKDENPLLIMNEDADTSLFAIYLKNPANELKRIYFSDGTGMPVLQWVPASNQYNKFKIIYSGDFPSDGVYQLLVQGTDLSGNLSGDLEYKIDFEVIHESTITYLMNYPNPFSTKTHFVFTLTGQRVPDYMIIQIMTITGKVVREITLNELGPIRIGKNISEYAWDGRDEFGDPLANGVYLYRVLTDMDGERIKHRETGADQYFKKEFGKMYLLR
jgi:hypothetical protein